MKTLSWYNAEISTSICTYVWSRQNYLITEAQQGMAKKYMRIFVTKVFTAN